VGSAIAQRNNGMIDKTAREAQARPGTISRR
jgi:hypothetical protein